MERVKAGLRTAAILFLFLMLLLAAGAAAADEHHTFALNCGGGGFVGRSASGEQSMVIPVPDEAFSAGEDREWTLEELRGLPDFRLEGAALRFTADSVQGYDLWYELVCGNTARLDGQSGAADAHCPDVQPGSLGDAGRRRLNQPADHLLHIREAAPFPDGPDPVQLHL